MRQAVFAIAVIATLCVAASAAHAGSISVDVAYTADDEITGLYLLDNTATLTDLTSSLGSDACDWRKVDTLTLNGLEASTTYQVIFRVENNADKFPAGKYNPAQLLAEISGTDLTGDLLSSSDWDYAIDTGKEPGDAGFSFGGLTWSSAVEDYTNGDTTGAKNMLLIGGPLAGISKDAAWIWSMASTFTADMDNNLWLRGSFTTGADPVPEPGTLALCGVGVVGMVLSRRRRLMRTA